MTALVILAAFILIWDIALAGHVAQLRIAPRALAALSGLAALLAVPAFVIAIATNLGLNGRSVVGVAWIWPATIAIFAAEAIYVTAQKLVNPLVGASIAAYDLLLLAIALARYIGDGGAALPFWALALVAAQATAMGAIAGPTALLSAYAVMLPIIAPAYPGRWRATRLFGALAAGLALMGTAAVVAKFPAGAYAVASYDRYADAPIHARPEDDFAIGVRVLAAVDAPPPLIGLRNDLALVDTTGAEAMSVVIDPAGTESVPLDSLARALEPLRRDSLLLIVALGTPAEAWHRQPPTTKDQYEASRIQSLTQIARRLHPDYLLPADEPCLSVPAEELSLDEWKQYLTLAARAIHAIDPHIKVAISASTFDGRDSALYAWAAAAGSPIDVAGFSLCPGFDGAATLEAQSRAVDRWMQALPQPPKEQWIFWTGGYPAAHGERAQELAVLGVLAWASSRSAIKGVIVGDAGDYGSITGVRAASGRLRPAAFGISRAIHRLRDQSQ
jgi:hypothetical protein